jgi:hypothetical protein
MPETSGPSLFLQENSKVANSKTGIRFFMVIERFSLFLITYQAVHWMFIHLIRVNLLHEDSISSAELSYWEFRR